MIDAVLAPELLPDIVERVLNVLQGGRSPQPDDAPQAGSDEPLEGEWTAIESIERSRRPDRPGVRALLRRAAADVLPLNGTGQGESEPGLMLALARFGDASCVVMGQDRLAQRGKPLGPAALREARRGMRLAQDLGLPLVSVIDTPGAALSKEAEEGGLAGEIARCLADLVMLPVPTVSVILGEGTGGGALALIPADLTIAAQHAWLAPLPPEGASAIIHRDTLHAAEMAESQGVASSALRRAGIVDVVVSEKPDAADEPEEFCRRMGHAIRRAIADLVHGDDGSRVDARIARYAAISL